MATWNPRIIRERRRKGLAGKRKHRWQVARSDPGGVKKYAHKRIYRSVVGLVGVLKQTVDEVGHGAVRGN